MLIVAVYTSRVCVWSLSSFTDLKVSLSLLTVSYLHTHTHTGPPVLLDQGDVVRRENEELSLDMRDPDSHPAFPSPSLVEWTRDGGEVVSSSENRVFNYSSIFIGSVEPSDAGQYNLTATNYQLDGVTLVGSDSASLTLNVLCEFEAHNYIPVKL